jgi:hypothetical protein
MLLQTRSAFPVAATRVTNAFPQKRSHIAFKASYSAFDLFAG